ncbi:helix-turn-helix domain-containing protein [Bacillus sp. F19]|nr:helix-turn-helix domain-containing protein [Bacillus sp. F19]
MNRKVTLSPSLLAKPKKKRITDVEITKMISLFEQGFRKTKIANSFGVSRQTVTNHLNKAGFK